MGKRIHLQQQGSTQRACHSKAHYRDSFLKTQSKGQESERLSHLSASNVRVCQIPPRSPVAQRCRSEFFALHYSQASVGIARPEILSVHSEGVKENLLRVLCPMWKQGYDRIPEFPAHFHRHLHGVTPDGRRNVITISVECVLPLELVFPAEFSECVR